MFSIEEQENLDEYLAARLEFGHEMTAQSLNQMTDAIERLYAELELDSPQIIPCLGPIQQVTFPALADLMLKQGRTASAIPRFIKLPLEPVIVEREWERLWRELFDYLDWEKSAPLDEGIGTLLRDKVERHLSRTLRSNLIVQTDAALGATKTEELERLCNHKMERPLGQVRQALLPMGAELSNLWGSLLNRLPEEYGGLLSSVINESEGVTVSRIGPSQEGWMGLWRWHWLLAYDFARRRLSLRLAGKESKSLDLWLDLSSGAVSYLFCHHCCFVYLKPLSVSFDDVWRLHNENGAAVEFVDGTRYFSWHGVEVDEEIITHPERIKIKTIDDEVNAERRRVLIERYGLENYIRGSGAKKVQEDDYGVLYRKELAGDEPIVAVKLVNSTPEPDGSFKTYVLRVPPDTQTAREAVAWSFGLTNEEYEPTEES